MDFDLESVPRIAIVHLNIIVSKTSKFYFLESSWLDYPSNRTKLRGLRPSERIILSS